MTEKTARIYERVRRFREQKRERPARIDKPASGQESVWDYPRPPRTEDVSKRVRVELDGAIIAETGEAKRVLETCYARGLSASGFGGMASLSCHRPCVASACAGRSHEKWSPSKAGASGALVLVREPTRPPRTIPQPLLLRLWPGRHPPVRLEFPILSLHPGLRQRCVAPDVGTATRPESSAGLSARREKNRWTRAALQRCLCVSNSNSLAASRIEATLRSA